MSSHPRAPAAALAAAVAAIALLLQSCSTEATLLESDVPLPTGMTVVRSADIRRAEGTVTGGRFLLGGAVNDAGETLASTVAAFEANGWRVASRDAGLDLSTARFTKGARVATLSITRRALEPDMSTGMLEVASAASGTATPGTATSATPR